MRTELGSEFWDIPLSSQENALFPPHTAWYLSGRAALAALLTELCAKREVRTAALPSWCCHTMIKPFLDAGLAVSFYPVYLEQGTLHQDFAHCPPCDVTFVMDYFGYRRATALPQDTVVIYDATHSIFSGIPEGAEYVFGSLRKWAGFLTGGYGFGPSGKALPAAADVRAEAYTALRRRAMSENTCISPENQRKNTICAYLPRRKTCLSKGPPALRQRRTFPRLTTWTRRFCGRNDGRMSLFCWNMCVIGTFSPCFSRRIARCLSPSAFLRRKGMPFGNIRLNGKFIVRRTGRFRLCTG